MVNLHKGNLKRSLLPHSIVVCSVVIHFNWKLIYFKSNMADRQPNSLTTD